MRDSTKNRILDVSIRLFGAHGLDKTRVEDIVADARISRATFYNYFHNKDEVLFSLIETELDTIQNKIDAALEREEDPYGKIKTYFLGMALGLREMVRLFNIQHDEIESLPPVPRKLIESNLKRGLNTIVEILDYGVKRGAFIVPNSELTAHVILSALDIFINPFKLGLIEIVTVEEQVDRVLDVIFYGFAKTRGARATGQKNGVNPALLKLNR